MRMKKLISLLAALTVVTACSVSAMAADNYVFGVDETYTYNVTDNASQSTILAVEGDTIDVDSIKYIDQNNTGSFTFGLTSAENVTVYGGGDTIAKTELGKIGGVSVIAGTIALKFNNASNEAEDIGNQDKLVVFAKTDADLEADGYGIVYDGKKLPGKEAITAGSYWSIVVAGNGVEEAKYGGAYVGTQKINGATVDVVEKTAQ